MTKIRHPSRDKPRNAIADPQNATLHVFHDGILAFTNAHVLAPLVEVFLGDH